MSARPENKFKVGDEVTMFGYGFGRGEAPLRVVTVTKANKIVTTCSDGSKWNALGRDTWNASRHIEPTTQEHRDAIADYEKRTRCLSIIELTRWRDLDTQTLNRIATILREVMP